MFVDDHPVHGGNNTRENDRLIPQSPVNFDACRRFILNFKIVEVMQSHKNSAKDHCYHRCAQV